MFKEFRKANGWTQSQLAEHVGVSKRTVEGWEQGRTTPDRRSRIELDKLGFDLFVLNRLIAGNWSCEESNV